MAPGFSPVRTGDVRVDRNLDAIKSALDGVDVSYTTTLLVAADFLGGWGPLSGFQSPGYRIWSTGEVELFGGLTGGATKVAAFTLPASIAPAALRQWAVGSYNGSVPVACLMKVDSLGNVVPVVNSNVQVFLDGVRWVAGA